MLIESTILVMQILIMATVAGNTWWAFKTRKSVGKALQAFYEYRREIAWLTARIDALEQKAKAQGNGRVEAGRGK
jgi:hypothetical protein